MLPLSLLEHLQSCLGHERLRTPQERSLELHVVRSKAHRSHALFPWATDASEHRVNAHEVLVVAAEQGVPVFGLESGVYTVPSSSVALVYVSKVDTTGLIDGPSPAAALTTAFLAHCLVHPPAGCSSVRIHVFARAQDQYLFPESIKNAKKRRLTDKELCRWWKRVFDEVAAATSATTLLPLELFYLLPGFEYVESLSYVPRNPAGPSWTYGHPYSTLSSCMGGGNSRTLNDLIPAFPDDPKARFLMSLTSSPVMPTGESGDYDDAYANAVGHATATAELAAGIASERKRLLAVGGGADEFWIRMGARQECMDGHLTAFFVVASQEGKEAATNRTDTAPVLPTVERTSYVRLWSELHNIDYSDMESVKEKYAAWREDVAATCANNSAELSLVRATVSLETRSQSAKRPIEQALPQPTVMKLQPRKKAKPT